MLDLGALENGYYWVRKFGFRGAVDDWQIARVAVHHDSWDWDKGMEVTIAMFYFTGCDIWRNDEVGPKVEMSPC